MQSLKKLFSMLSQAAHLLLMVGCALLLIGSSNLMMLRQVPPSASFWDISHVWLGWLTALLSIVFLIRCCIHGRWRSFFPWLALQWRAIALDVQGIAQGKVPSAGGAGLFSAIEGITVLALVATGITGILWFVTQGSADALSWRQWHHSAAHLFIVMFVVHIICALSHLIDLVRD